LRSILPKIKEVRKEKNNERKGRVVRKKQINNVGTEKRMKDEKGKRK
jgi:hypothetical protein